MFAVDGAAPWAKLMEQRGRRAGKESVTRFDRIAFTPGTGFMDRLDGYLGGFSRWLVSRGRGSVIEAVVSGSRVPGEGEEKVMQRLLTLTGNIGIASVDSDMMLQPHFLGPLGFQRKVHVLNWNEKTLFRPDLVGDSILYAPQNTLYDYTLRVDPCVETMRLHFDLSVAILAVCGNDTFPGLWFGVDAARSFDVVRETIDVARGVLRKGKGLVECDDGVVDLEVLRDIFCGVRERELKGRGYGDFGWRDKMGLGGERDRDVELFLKSLGWAVGSAVEGRCLDRRWMHSRIVDDGVETAFSVTVDEVLEWMERKGWNGVLRWKEKDGKSLYEGREGLTPEMCAVSLIPESKMDILDPRLHRYVKEFDSFCVKVSLQHRVAAKAALMAQGLECIDAASKPLQQTLAEESKGNVLDRQVGFRKGGEVYEVWEDGKEKRWEVPDGVGKWMRIGKAWMGA
ncbi:5'-3' exoribonuclease 2 [Phlyctochytrium planicorne]|nr:5'-3' exoribonuclease 2 [Phlyctochytrium planicorne]